jgi:hypothetical protein
MNDSGRTPDRREPYIDAALHVMMEARIGSSKLRVCGTGRRERDVQREACVNHSEQRAWMPTQGYGSERMITMQFEHDTKVHAVYIRLRDLPFARGYDLDTDRHVDFGADNQPIGIELLNVHLGVDVVGLPEQDAVAELLRAHGSSILSRASQ